MDKKKYEESIGKAGFAYGNVVLKGNSAASRALSRVADADATDEKSETEKVDDPYSYHQGSDENKKPEDPYSFHQGGAADKPLDPNFAEKTPEQQYQNILNQAAQKGLPVVVVFGSQTARDTEKQATQTLKNNMKEGEAMYLYVDTDKLDPNSDLGKVARRNSGSGQGLGDTGKSDLAFTGIYTVEKKADGSLGLGKSTATFWGGREEISAIMKDQLRYAKAATLNLGGGDTKPETKPSDPRTSDNPDQRPSDEKPILPKQESPSDQLPPPPPPPPDKDPESKQDRNPADQNKETEKKEQEEEQRRRDALSKKEKEEAEAAEAQRLKLRKERQKEMHAAGGKDYPIEQYADGWGRFLERNEMAPAALRNALDEFGKEMILGEFDGKKLSDLMSKVGQSDQSSMTAALERANKELSTSGIKLNVELDSTGKVSALELAELAKDGVKVRATASGAVTGTAVGGQGLREMPLSLASIRLAKRSEPAACP